ASNDTVLVQFYASRDSPTNSVPEKLKPLELYDERRGVYCQQEFPPYVKAASLLDVSCSDPPTCDLYDNCLKQPQNCPDDTLKGENCDDRSPCLSVLRIHPQGMVQCVTHNRTSQEIDYHYLGFDGKCCKTV
ncbi:unnamed protein product, partial [Allacma fusca]